MCTPATTLLRGKLCMCSLCWEGSCMCNPATILLRGYFHLPSLTDLVTHARTTSCFFSRIFWTTLFRMRSLFHCLKGGRYTCRPPRCYISRFIQKRFKNRKKDVRRLHWPYHWLPFRGPPPRTIVCHAFFFVVWSPSL